MTTLAAGDTRPTASPAVGRANGVHPDWLRVPAIAEPLAKHFTLTPKVAETAVDKSTRANHDADLERAAKRSAWMRQGFYIVVLLTALAGQVSGATEKLHIPLPGAIPATAALELGGVVVMANADVRRRLGESAVFSRILSALIAAWAVAFNWLAHADHLLGGFFAGMSALGYLVWLMHVENQRRDRLRATGDLPPVPPRYEFWSHWLMHPWVTLRARSLAKESQSPGRTKPLDLYASLDAARGALVRERRTRALGAVIERQLRASARTPQDASIALTTYDLDEVAKRVQEHADYARLAELIAARIHPDAVAGAGAPKGKNAQLTAIGHASVSVSVGALTEAATNAPKAHPDALVKAPSDAPPDAPPGLSDVFAEAQPDTPGKTRPTVVQDSHVDARPSRPRTVAKTRSPKRGPDAGAVTRLRRLAAHTGSTPSVRRVMTELGVGAPKAKALLAELDASVNDTEETP